MSGVSTLRTSILIILLIIAGVAALLGLSTWPSRSPVDLRVVSSRPLDKMNGKEFMLVTLAISNRGRTRFLFGPVEEIHAMVGGRWTEVYQDFDGGHVDAGSKFQKRLVLPGGAESIRLQFNYRFDPNSPTRMAELLGKLGPTAEKLVFYTPWLGKRVWPDNYGYDGRSLKQITVEAKIPPSASKPDV